MRPVKAERITSSNFADVMELVDMQDLGSCAERRVGSSPFIRTRQKKPCNRNGYRVSIFSLF